MSRPAALIVLILAFPSLPGCSTLLLAGGTTAAVAASDRRTLGNFVDDQNIELKVHAAISNDKPLAEQVHVNSTSFNGVVLLTGETPTIGERDRVLEYVRQVPGVRRTVNELRLAPPTSLGSRTNDAWLTSKVKTSLFGLEKVETHHVKIVTENGVVYLMGLVRRTEGDRITEAARHVGGVQRVVKLFEYLD